MAYGRVFALVSAEPAQRASGVSLLNKPTVTTLKRPRGCSGWRAGRGGGGEGYGLPSRN